MHFIFQQFGDIQVHLTDLSHRRQLMYKSQIKSNPCELLLVGKLSNTSDPRLNRWSAYRGAWFLGLNKAAAYGRSGHAHSARVVQVWPPTGGGSIQFALDAAVAGCRRCGRGRAAGAVLRAWRPAWGQSLAQRNAV